TKKKQGKLDPLESVAQIFEQLEEKTNVVLREVLNGQGGNIV
ncbi:conserved hypothetical protein, partial [delta proteobacterium NaphS2]